MNFNRKNSLLLLSGIIILAILIRFYKLGQIPHGLTWDEAAIGYNGYAILTTRRDEWLVRLPISFKSFGDYKAPLAIYLNGPFVYLFGANPTAVRLPFAISGIMAILGIYFLIYLSFSGKTQDRRFAGLVAAATLTLMPWHVFFSRVGFESGLALTLVIWSAIFFFLTLQSKGKSTFLSASLSVFLAVLSMYAYHSAKIFVPLLALLLVSGNVRKIKSKIPALLLSGFFGLVLLIPMIKDAVYGMGLERAEVTIFSQNMSFFDTAKTFFYQFAGHFHPNFLIFGETTNLRHGDGKWGIILPTTAILFFSSIFFLFNKLKNKQKIPAHFWFYLGWTIIGIIPSAIATEAPHSNRSLAAIPGIIGLSVTGLIWTRELLSSLKSKYIKLDSKGNSNLLAPSVLGTFICLHLLFFVSFASDYLNKYRLNSADAFRDGYLEAVKIAGEYQRGLGGKPKTSQIVISEEYGQPYIYILFANKINPIEYRWGAIQPYLFQDKISNDDLNKTDTLLVATKYSDIPIEKADHLIYGSDGEIRFKLYYLPPGDLPPRDESQITEQE